MKPGPKPRAPGAPGSSPADRLATGRAAKATLYAERRAANRCIHCGGPLPDPREQQKAKLEAKIARLRDQIRLLSVPAPPPPVKPAPELLDSPIGKIERKH